MECWKRMWVLGRLAFTQGSEDGMGLRGTESHSCGYSLGAGTEKRLI